MALFREGTRLFYYDVDGMLSPFWVFLWSLGHFEGCLGVKGGSHVTLGGKTATLASL